MNQGKQIELYKALVIHLWYPLDVACILLVINILTTLCSDESPTNQGTQKETNNPWVIHPWQPRDEQV